ncbi:hypothetical protein [Phaeobacter gallaeciensis]|uniref:hypothetical protein n=1 Tax=Phaeobacter gallaeciensis TaxID=60890 RepID=UPI00237F58EC|nr:hypothetical protein [Phaeobacter gallaeciensis]MDE4193534.1 hypothetical protein [Phaeobacter gallaeciensis]MDE4201830.1 hypothetical protein [Phaeobacter gallaeciensis]MDE4205982.1 hypothetical protein [Phaeobacter gallaeciensis]MDE4210126.1 hypothetical protein [Phaeobacter gallaeciensis]MDE4218493.1 hypothetical protein [Phaeobacter gallaeciensis]
MSYPEFSDFPPIPQRSAAEADFDTKMSALFQHFATTHRAELIALIDFLKTGSTIIGGALNATTVGLDTPAEGKFTALEADSLGGAAVQSTASDTDGDGKLVRMDGAGAAALSRYGLYKGSGDGYNIDQAAAGDKGLVATSNPGTWPSENPGSFAWVTSQSIYSDAAVLQRAVYGYAPTGTPGNVRAFERIRANDGSAWSEWTEVVTSANVQANGFDRTSGAVLKVGAFGLGGLGDVIDDFSTAPQFSEFIAGGGAGVIDGPPDGGSYRPGLVAFRSASDRSSILMFTASGIAVRSYLAGAPDSDWISLFSTENLVGTVSQSGGAPTGAVIERGSNANGEYVRFADGTQMCWQDDADDLDATNASGSLYRSSVSGNWTFPAAFLGGSSISVSAQPDSSVRWAQAHVSSSTSAVFRQFQATASSTTISTRLFAIGRWF